MPTLLRRDLAGIGKKEIGDVPILGTLMKLGGTVLIDRENSQSARAAMEPLIDVLKKEGRSVCVAPEGTRSPSKNLGRFKKGAFHLAMQAGVPIVPIVIHNATDVAPKGQYVFRPATVKITVLPAVDTGDWTTATIDKHIHDVRDMYLEVLDQMRYQLDSGEPAAGGETTAVIRKQVKKSRTIKASKSPKAASVSDESEPKDERLKASARPTE